MLIYSNGHHVATVASKTSRLRLARKTRFSNQLEFFNLFCDHDKLERKIRWTTGTQI